MQICVGMDVHSKKLTCFATPLDENDTEGIDFCTEFNREFKLASGEKSDMLRIANWLKGVDHSILIESGTKTHEVFWTLVDAGCTVVVAYANDLYRITKSVKKTDFHDCAELAHYMRRYMMGEREFSTCLMVDSVWMNRRQLCRIYASLSNDMSDLKRRIRSYMLLRAIQFKGMESDITSEACLRRLEEEKDPALRFLIAQARFMKGQMKEVLKQIEDEFEQVESYRLIKTIPGFGVITSSYLSAMIVDINRFDTQSKFAAYFGIVPKQRESADHAQRCGITHRGDDIARELLVKATILHISHDKDRTSKISRMYDRLRGRGKAPKKSFVACTNKITGYIYAMLKEGTEYHEGD